MANATWIIYVLLGINIGFLVSLLIYLRLGSHEPVSTYTKDSADDARHHEEVFSDEFLNDLRIKITHAIDRDLATTERTLNAQVHTLSQKLSNMVAGPLSKQLQLEVDKYQSTITAATSSTQALVDKTQSLLQSSHDQIQAQLREVVEKKQTYALKQFEENFNDVIKDYLIEALGAHVDLGAQSAYIFQTLEEHKEDILRDIDDATL
jgi:hypothetical protein